MAIILKGRTVTLYTKKKTGKDSLNKDIYTEIPEEIENVLINYSSEQEILDTMNLYGRKAIYTLCIPKTDMHDWAGCKVGFFGEIWRVIGYPVKGQDELLPLDWNMKVRVERYE